MLNKCYGLNHETYKISTFTFISNNGNSWNQATETIISLGYILDHYSQKLLLDLCIVLGK